MQLVVHTHSMLPLVLASTHAMTDFHKPTVHLSPYVLLIAWPSTIPISAVFFISSVVHFGRDIGIQLSVQMHILWCIVAAIDVDLSFQLFTLYYCGFHAPTHCLRNMHRLKFVCAATLLCLFVWFAVISNLHAEPSTIVIEEWMQRLVVAHVLSDEIFGESAPRDAI